jgi:hypothetical protein
LTRTPSPASSFAEAGRHRRHIDDRPATTAETGGHATRRFLGRDVGALEVDRDHAVELLLGNVDETGVGREDARVVDERIEAAELGVDGGEQGADIGGFGDVGADGERAPALRPDASGDRIRRSLVRDVAQCDVVAAAGGQQRRCRTDATGAARDEKNAAHRMSFPSIAPERGGRESLTPKDAW